MENTAYRAIAIVGVGAVLPDAPNAPAFWQNVKNGRYSISEFPPDRWDPAFYYDPIPRYRIRLTPRSAAGCASTSGSL